MTKGVLEQKALCMSLSKVGLALWFCVCRSQDFLSRLYADGR